MTTIQTTLDEFKDRRHYFKRPTRNEIVKNRKKVEVDSSIEPIELSQIIKNLKHDEYLSLPKDYRIIPKEWEKFVGKRNKNDLAAHGPGFEIEVYRGLPSVVMLDNFERLDGLYVEFYWFGDDKRKRSFRLVTLCNAHHLWEGTKIHGEKIKVEGSCKEARCTVPSMSMEEHVRYTFTLTHLPLRDDENRLHEWVNFRGSCYCPYSQIGKRAHYKEGYCHHEIDAFWMAANERSEIAFNIFPQPIGLMKLYKKSRNQVVRGYETLRDLEIECMLQLYMHVMGPKNLLTFELPKPK
jgi:hypothetical protein